MNINEIITAWAISFNPTPQQKELAERRLEICETCESKRIAVVAFCSECGCPIAKKIFTNTFNPCPLLKWEEVDRPRIPLKEKKTLT